MIDRKWNSNVTFVETNANILNKIIDCLEKAYGYGHVAVKGLNAAAIQEAIIKLKMPEASTKERTLERISEYQAGVDEHAAQNRYIQAMRTYQDGIAYIESVTESMNDWRFGHPFVMHPIFPNLTDIASKHPRYCLASRDPQPARQTMNLII